MSLPSRDVERARLIRERFAEFMTVPKGMSHTLISRDEAIGRLAASCSLSRVTVAEIVQAGDILQEIADYVRAFNDTESPETPVFNRWFARIAAHVGYSLYWNGLRSGLDSHQRDVEAVAEMAGEMLAPLVIADGQKDSDTLAQLITMTEHDLADQYGHAI